VVVKGVTRADDAQRCVEAGATAVWVSNHGGRQLDRTIATAEALPLIRAELNADIPVYVDGGVRTGLDVLTGLALGAEVVFLGRLPLYGLAVGGEAGVIDVLNRVRDELESGLRRAGCSRPGDTRGLVLNRTNSP
jgi:4-hydroxymandelate oxidase